MLFLRGGEVAIKHLIIEYAKFPKIAGCDLESNRKVQEFAMY
jgi:hypothetical protein